MESIDFGDYYYYNVKRGLFAGFRDATLSVANVAFGIDYNITLSEGKNGSES